MEPLNSGNEVEKDLPLSAEEVGDAITQINFRLVAALEKSPSARRIIQNDLEDETRTQATETIPSKDADGKMWRNVFSIIPGEISVRSLPADEPLVQEGLYVGVGGAPSLEYRSIDGGMQSKYSNSTKAREGAFGLVSKLEARLAPK